MGDLRDIATIARWEVKKSFSPMGRNVLPLAIALFVLLIGVTSFATQSGMHLQDGMYVVGIDDPVLAHIISGDARFTVYQYDANTLLRNQKAFDLIIVQGQVTAGTSEKAMAALRTVERDYAKYVSHIYTGEDDLFAAYPLWIDIRTVKSELDFLATQSGRSVIAAPGRDVPLPEGPVVEIPTPSPALGFTKEELRQELVKTSSENSQISRYSEVLAAESPNSNFRIPSQLSPPLPFDSIILIFVFIFPLYFISQFFMMSIMNERIERKGEVLLSTPVKGSSIIIGKMLPFFLGMIAICMGITLWINAPFVIILPLVPVIFFFLANALLIGMLSRSFKELSFISIFFSTVATLYLFFPSVFANVHAISFISPLTLIILALQGTPWTITDYLYSTSLFWLTSVALFYIATKNFKEERLFSEKNLVPRLREFLSEVISTKHPFLSLFLLTGFSIPFIFMVQLMCLVLFFNLPMPYSLVLLLLSAALVEEFAKGIGIYTIYSRDSVFFTWRNVVLASAATAIGFLVGEKLLLFVTLAQITESVFGNVLFLSLGALWMPLLLHFTGVLIVSCCLKLRGRRWFTLGLAIAMIVHCLYNLYIIMEWLS
jgi:ABC-type Na+ efflux pump permease subunit